MKKENCPIISKIERNIDPVTDIAELLIKAISPDSKSLLREGGFINSNFNAELDELRNAKANGTVWVQELEAKEKELTGIKTLKITQCHAKAVQIFWSDRSVGNFCNNSFNIPNF